MTPTPTRVVVRMAESRREQAREEVDRWLEGPGAMAVTIFVGAVVVYLGVSLVLGWWR